MNCAAHNLPVAVTLRVRPTRTLELCVLSYLHVTGRTLIMGDLHGCYQQLLTTLSLFNFDPE